MTIHKNQTYSKETGLEKVFRNGMWNKGETGCGEDWTDSECIDGEAEINDRFQEEGNGLTEYMVWFTKMGEEQVSGSLKMNV